MAELTVDLEEGAQPKQKETWYELPGEKVAASLNVDPEQGLSTQEAASRFEQYGPNKFAEAKAEPR